jgi:hypothetical protein
VDDTDLRRAHHLRTGAARALADIFKALLATQPALHAHRVWSNFRRVPLAAPRAVNAPQEDSKRKPAVFDVQGANSLVMMEWKLVMSATLVSTPPAEAKLRAEVVRVVHTVLERDFPVHTLLVLAAQLANFLLGRQLSALSVLLESINVSPASRSAPRATPALLLLLVLLDV